MKKLATLSTWMIGIGLALGQTITHWPGQVYFSNTESVIDKTDFPPGISNHLVYDLMDARLVGTQYKAELYYLDTDTIDTMRPITASVSSFRSTPTAVPGTWSNLNSLTFLPTGYGGVDVTD